MDGGRHFPGGAAESCTSPPIPTSAFEASFSGGLSRHVKRRLAGLIDGWKKCKSFRLFLEPVDVVQMECPTYYDVIKEPMDLQTMEVRGRTEQRRPSRLRLHCRVGRKRRAL